jgi:hypothetical protein
MRCTCAALLVLVPSLASAGGALDKPAFTATPAELLAEAKKAPPGDAGVVVLRHDEDIAFDEHGLATERARWVYAITSDEGVDGWGTVGHWWRPWAEKRPALRARVISASGAVTVLDPATIIEEPADVGERRRVEAPLPAVQPGCVVEEEITITDTVPTPGGRSLFVEITADAQVTLAAPVALKAKVVEHALPPKVAARHTVAAGRETWSYTFANHLPASRESLEPDDSYTRGR